MRDRGYKLLIEFNLPLFRTLVEYLKPKQGERILDIGCHKGRYVKELEKYTENIIGVDIDSALIEIAVTDRVWVGEATKLDFQDNYFDKIYSLHTIEHVPDTKKFLSEGARVLKPEGIFILAYPWELFRGMQVFHHALRKYKNPFLVGNIHLHRFTPSKIKEVVKETSFHYIESKFIFTIYPLSLQYLTVLKKMRV